MDLREAFRRTIRNYFKDGSGLKELKSVQKRMKYDKKYFDQIEEEKFGEVTTHKTDGTKKKKGKK